MFNIFLVLRAKRLFFFTYSKKNRRIRAFEMSCNRTIRCLPYNGRIMKDAVRDAIRTERGPLEDFVAIKKRMLNRYEHVIRANSISTVIVRQKEKKREIKGKWADNASEWSGNQKFARNRVIRRKLVRNFDTLQHYHYI